MIMILIKICKSFLSVGVRYRVQECLAVGIPVSTSVIVITVHTGTGIAGITAIGGTIGVTVITGTIGIIGTIATMDIVIAVIAGGTGVTDTAGTGTGIPIRTGGTESG